MQSLAKYLLFCPAVEFIGMTNTVTSVSQFVVECLMGTTFQANTFDFHLVQFNLLHLLLSLRSSYKISNLSLITAVFPNW